MCKNICGDMLWFFLGDSKGWKDGTSATELCSPDLVGAVQVQVLNWLSQCVTTHWVLSSTQVSIGCKQLHETQDCWTGDTLAIAGDRRCPGLRRRRLATMTRRRWWPQPKISGGDTEWGRSKAGARGTTAEPHSPPLYMMGLNLEVPKETEPCGKDLTDIKVQHQRLTWDVVASILEQKSWQCPIFH